MQDKPDIPLRIALTVGHGWKPWGWQAMLIDRIAGDPRFALTGRIFGKASRDDPRLGLAAKTTLLAERALLHKWLLPYDALPASQHLSSLPLLEEDTADLVLSLGPFGLSTGQLDAARLGELSVRFAGATDPLWVRLSPDVRKIPLIPVELLSRSRDRPASEVIRRAGYNPKPGAVLSGVLVAEKSVLLAMRAMRDLSAGPVVPEDPSTPMPRPRLPGAIDVAFHLAGLTSTVTCRSLEGYRARKGRARDSWRLAGGTGDVAGFAPAEATEITGGPFMMADPFLFQHDETTWLFYEAMNADNGDGWIEAARLSGGRIDAPRVALRCPYHLSFPYVFADGDQIYMMPETQGAKRLEVWRAESFPDRWVLHTTAFEGQQLAESSLFRDDSGQWWLLTNLSDHHAFQDHSSELYLFSVDGPDLKRIVPHPGNPVVIGADRARNAGAIIRQDGRLFRPSQNNSYGVYGYGLNVMEVMNLDPDCYSERPFRAFTPDDRPGCNALHHLSVLGDQYVIDWSVA